MLIEKINGFYLAQIGYDFGIGDTHYQAINDCLNKIA